MGSLRIDCNQARGVRSNVNLPNATKPHDASVRPDQWGDDLIPSPVFTFGRYIYFRRKMPNTEFRFEFRPIIGPKSHAKKHACFSPATTVLQVEQVIPQLLRRDHG